MPPLTGPLPRSSSLQLAPASWQPRQHLTWAYISDTLHSVLQICCSGQYAVKCIRSMAHVCHQSMPRPTILSITSAQAHLAARVEASKTAGALPPRFDRLVAKLGISPKEIAALRFILHKQACCHAVMARMRQRGS
jgi:hypothetical protein